MSANNAIVSTNTNSINDCNTSFGKDAMNRVSTNGLFVVSNWYNNAIVSANNAIVSTNNTNVPI
ncbi:MAG: hypothetical protein V7K41_11790 [Nostoc sp.]|uniref:hypothetical protein n=1 Tax=Nostoc sp. TaxID=1180 RepID=UPI002FF67483